jgi:hypothetical protein
VLPELLEGDAQQGVRRILRENALGALRLRRPYRQSRHGLFWSASQASASEHDEGPRLGPFVALLVVAL